MPIVRGIDGIGPFFRYGKSGKKFHYSFHNEISEKYAYHRALLQAQAIHASQTRAKAKKK
jgi:hypothetical protein